MNRLISKIKSPIEIIKIIGKFEPVFLFFSFFQIIIKATLPILYVYFPKILIDLLSSSNIKYLQIAQIIFIYSLILLILNIINSILKNRIDFHADVFSKKVKNKIGSISMQLEFQNLENPEIRDLIKLASKTSEITDSLLYIQNIISSLFTISGLTYLTLRFNSVFIIIIILTFLIKAITIYIEHSHNKKMRKLLVENSRYIEYLFNVAFYNKGTAKEIRINNLEDWYMSKNKQYRKEMIQLQYKSFKLYAFHNILNEVVLAIQSFIVLYFLSKYYISSMISLADFTLYFSSITTLTINIASITVQLSNYNQQILNVSDYNNLTKLFDKNINEENFNVNIDKNNIEIEFKDVSFVYPNTTKKVLNKINIKIKNHEKLVIVGLNGAGKTTFIKLLCKFYKPNEGIITLNGIDIWKIPNSEYYNIISAVFQDFSNFSFSIKDNITLSENCNNSILNETLKKIGLDAYIDSLNYKEETYINKSFNKSGIELSGGLNQKLAIARCIYKDSQILILDEPTANLDPIAENEIYQNFFELSENKTALFISHRLAACTISDNIAVFVNGEIVEYGPHKRLIEEKGIYYELFIKQSKNYTSK